MQPEASLRIAFFGGSFDPPHAGHVAVARAARDALFLDRVLFAPVGTQPLKPQGATAAFADRVAMTRLAIAGERGFAVSMADAPAAAGRPNFTLDTLRRLRVELPASAALFCLMGADSFRSLRAWHHAAEIPFAADLIVASRPGESLHDLAGSLPAGLTLSREEPSKPLHSNIEVHAYRIVNASGESVPLYVLPGLDVEISASEIRSQLRGSDGGAIGSVPTLVVRYIREHRLYQRSVRPRLAAHSGKGLRWSGENERDRMASHLDHEQTRILVQAAAAACEDKKGADTRILELDPVDSGLSDFFLVTSATNDRQAIAIADEIEMRLKKNFNVLPNSVEGRRHAGWILLDYVDFVVHVFLAERRAFYDIERLRKSARPLTPAEFDEELKHALAEKTRAARSHASGKRAKAGAAKTALKKTGSARRATTKSAIKKTAAKSAAKKSRANKPSRKG